jgi:outer membrane protein assembly factor BamB
LKFSRELTEKAGPWQMYGNEASHSSTSGITSNSLEKIWDSDVGAGFGSFSPTIIGGIVYVGTLNGEIHALGLSTGKELASKSLGGAIFSGPVVSDSIMVVASSQSKENILAYNIYSGKIIWSKKIADVESSPAVSVNQIYVVTIKGDLYELDLQTGEEIFHKTFDGPIRTSPAIADSLCVFGCDDGNVYALNTASGKMEWKYDAGSSIWCSASMSGTHSMGDDSSIFVGTNGGRLLALSRDGELKFDFATGEKILSMPISDEKRVYFGCDDGNVYALDIHYGALLWKVHTDAPIVASASQTKNQIFFGSFDKNLYVIDKSDGKVEQKIDLSGRVRTQPAIYKNYLVVGAEDSDVFGFLIK